MIDQHPLVRHAIMSFTDKASVMYAIKSLISSIGISNIPANIPKVDLRYKFDTLLSVYNQLNTINRHNPISHVTSPVEDKASILANINALRSTIGEDMIPPNIPRLNKRFSYRNLKANYNQLLALYRSHKEAKAAHTIASAFIRYKHNRRNGPNGWIPGGLVPGYQASTKLNGKTGVFSMILPVNTKLKNLKVEHIAFNGSKTYIRDLYHKIASNPHVQFLTDNISTFMRNKRNQLDPDLIACKYHIYAIAIKHKDDVYELITHLSQGDIYDIDWNSYDFTEKLMSDLPSIDDVCVYGFSLLPVSMGIEINYIRMLQNMRAFEPMSNRAYHDATLVSTTMHKLCIYETYHYLYRSKDSEGNIIADMQHASFRYIKRNQWINDFYNEPVDVRNIVKEGRLYDFMTIMARRHNCEMLCEFFVKSGDNVGFGILPDYSCMAYNGESGYARFYSGSTKVFLYYKEHVAPRKLDLENQFDIKAIIKANSNRYIMNPIYKKKIKSDPIEVWGYDIETNIIPNSDGKCMVNAICAYKYKLVTPSTYINGQYVKPTYGPDDSEAVSIYITDSDITPDYTVCDKFAAFLYYKSTKINYSKTHSKDSVGKIYMYGFNCSRFDNLFIFESLRKYGKSVVSAVIVKNTIKCITFNNIKIMDISLFYCGSLRTVSDSFGLGYDLSKGVYPYKFANLQLFDYIGPIPALEYWNSEADMQTYIDNEHPTLFDMKAYTLKYCMLDCKLTANIAVHHLDNCIGMTDKTYVKDGVTYNRHYDLRGCPTVSAVSIKYFNSVYQNEPIYASPDHIIEKERLAYKGGRTEVFKRMFKSMGEHDKLYYYDINSSYPYAMTKPMPIKYIRSNVFKTERRMTIASIKDTNLYYVRSVYRGNDNRYIPNLLYRHSKTGNIIAVSDCPYSYQWGCEIKEAIDNDCDIYCTEIHEYHSAPIFKEFAEHFYTQRLVNKKSNPAYAQFLKTVLNSLYGKFAQAAYNASAICDTSEDISHIFNNHNNKLHKYSVLDNGSVVVEYSTVRDRTCYLGQLCRFSSYITGLARCNLSIFMRDVGHSNVYYCDTDSVFTNVKPSDYLVSQDRLGAWKNEDIKDRNGKTLLVQAVTAMFIAPKAYTFTISDNCTKSRAKGQRACDIKLEHLQSAINNKPVSIVNDSMFKRTLCGVNIVSQSRTLRTVYNKRIFNGNNSSPYKTIDDWYSNR